MRATGKMIRRRDKECFFRMKEPSKSAIIDNLTKLYNE